MKDIRPDIILALRDGDMIIKRGNKFISIERDKMYNIAYWEDNLRHMVTENLDVVGIYTIARHKLIELAQL